LLFERERERESVQAGVVCGVCGWRRIVQSIQRKAGVPVVKYSGLRSTRRKIVIVAAVVAMLSTVMAVPASAEGSHGRDAEVEVDTTAASVPGLAELLDATDATVADGVDVHANADTSVVFDSGDGHVEIPDDPNVGVALTSPAAGTITVGVPGSPDAGVVASDGSVVYNNAYRDTSIVVQPQIDGGVRMITVLDSPKAPTSFDYPLTVDQGQSMALTADGGAVVTGQDGATVLTVPAPWAFDANGAAVAADYMLTGNTLTLNVHPTDTTAYPIITDPVLTWGWVTGTLYFNKIETRLICTGGLGGINGITLSGLWLPILTKITVYLSLYSCVAGALGRCIKVKSYGAVYIYTGNHCN